MTNQKNELSKLRTAEDLQREQRRLRLIIRTQEQELRKRVQKVPGELFYSGMNTMLPKLVRGKVSSFVLNAGRECVNKAFREKSNENGNPKLVTAAKQAGIFTLLRIVYKAFMKKK